jgi:hypothetical protein
VGKSAAFEGSSGLSREEFTDGAKQTLLVIEAGEAVPWTKPEELPFDRDQPLPALGFISKKRFFAAMADAHVRWIPKDVDAAVLRAFITRNAADEPGLDE